MRQDNNGHDPVEFEVEAEKQGLRLDVFLAGLMDGSSRARISRAIEAGELRVNGTVVKRSYRLSLGDRVEGSLAAEVPDGPEPEDIPLNILYEDDHVVVINKPSGMVVHPSKGHWSGTLASALRYHFDELSSIGGPTRPGIVHRLDRDTTGVIVTAKTDLAHQHLAKQFEQRNVEKQYFAIVNGKPDHDRDLISEPIGPHPNQRAKMAIRREGRNSRPAETFYECVKSYQKYSTLRLRPRTGRTHQIRVHLAHIQCPVLCDRLYSGASQIGADSLRGEKSHDTKEVVVLARQALHAERLCLTHPESGDKMTFTAPLPPDMQTAIEYLEQRSQATG